MIKFFLPEKNNALICRQNKFFYDLDQAKLSQWTIAANLQYGWLIQGPSKAILDLEKACCTLHSVTIKSLRVLKDKFTRSVGQELTATYSNRNH